MSDKEFSLSRRKALAGLGSIGAASALGLGGTYAQFTDTETESITFTAGGIDGTLEMAASYNGNDVSGELENVETGEGVGSAFHLSDVKPGDYGSIAFCLEVENNPAYVSSCLGYEDSTDNVVYEPEVREDDDLTEGNIGDEDASTDGEIPGNLWMIPYYNNECVAEFFDSGWPNYDNQPDEDWTPGDMGAYKGEYGGTSIAFWNSREGENDGERLQPRSLKDIANNKLAIGTENWNDSGTSLGFISPGEEQLDPEVDKGCVVLDGRMATASDGETYVDAQGGSQLEPGNTLHFGYDWHIPYTVGNAMQGDSVTMQAGFVFNQVRHADSITFQNSYHPGRNTPNDTTSD